LFFLSFLICCFSCFISCLCFFFFLCRRCNQRDGSFMCELLSITSHSMYSISRALTVVTFLLWNNFVLTEVASGFSLKDLNLHIVLLPHGTSSLSALLSLTHMNFAP
jgi:hypothetical protein